jgi:hypothetical protein
LIRPQEASRYLTSIPKLHRGVFKVFLLVSPTREQGKGHRPRLKRVFRSKALAKALGVEVKDLV